MDFQKYLQVSAAEINREVEKILEKELQEAKQIDKKLVPLIKAFISACQGGKGIRGTLVKLGYEIAAHLPGVKAPGSHLDSRSYGTLEGGRAISKVAAAYEIMHTAILVHDDIMDKSLTRRDRPSLYAVLGDNHYGISQAISLGDWGFFKSYKIISESKFDLVRKNNALILFSQIMMDTGLGQMLDLQKVSPMLVMKFKTAYYTIAGPLQLGAVLGGASKDLIKILGDFGENLGIAFQIKDDILDFEVSGKIGVDEAKKQAEECKEQALKVLPKITKNRKLNTLLQQLAKYLIERKN